MKKIRIIGSFSIIGVSLVISSLIFYQKSLADTPNVNLNKTEVTTSTKKMRSQTNNQKNDIESFKLYNETLVYDIYFFSPDDDNGIKRQSLGERMTHSLLDLMCPAIPTLTENTQSWNEILDVVTIEVNEVEETKRETVTDYRIKTSQGGLFDLRSRAVYELQGGKWIMASITPEQRGS